MFGRAKKKLLSNQEIIDRLRISDEAVVSEIYEICRRQLDQEGHRSNHLDSKANSLVGMISIYLSLLSGLAGISLKRKFSIEIFLDVHLFYCLAFVFSFVALLFGLKSAKVRSEFRTPGEYDVFNKNMFKRGLTVYKRYLAAHYWKIYRKNYVVNEEKGWDLKISYYCILFSVVALAIFCAKVFIYLIKNGGYL